MRLNEYAGYDAMGLAELVRGRDIDAAELARLALAAMEKLNPSLNAVIETYPERGTSSLATPVANVPFAGVPFLLKDTGATEAGKAQSCGSRIGNGYIADTDAYLTERYKGAGLNILGRSTLPEFAQAATTESIYSGATRNPWNADRSTGGSSGGAAAAVASGMVPMAHGTDTGGSIRIPAACCGLVGLKPSRGRISKGPLLDETLYGGLNTEHVLTRSVRDTALALDISCQPAPGDPFIIPSPARAYVQELQRDWEPMRIAVTWQTHTGKPVSSEMAEATRKIANLCSDLGHRVVEAAPAFDAEAYAKADTVVWAYSTAHEVKRLAAATGKPIDARYLERPTLEAMGIAEQLTLDDWFAAMATYNRMNRDIAGFFGDYDVLITPTVASTAPPLGTLNSNRDISFHDFMEITGNFCPHTSIFNVSGQPAISLPLALSDDGLPIGIQFVARYGDEACLLRLAAFFEQALPWRDRVPPICASRLKE
ncbi:amidase [Pseudomaricurvus alkylphenolicus]|uniref:amidase n=1 Tax=Pseudomaricurvus alkylphenolicus TaxID=1306991 RepID=UPI00142235EE|nr:amidase [Pseudomaricurvus alkylphenolicus]NIB38381.1 amidase [Pseudomaricurvus alkylphenolicus]